MPLQLLNGVMIITYSVLISYCFALHPYEKHELIKPELVIDYVKKQKSKSL